MNPFELLKNAGEIQKRMQEMQVRLATLTVTGQSGAGLVSVEMNGKLELTKVHISKEVIDPSDSGMLEDLVLSAVNNAQAKAREMIAKEAGGSLSGLGIDPSSLPPPFGL